VLWVSGRRISSQGKHSTIQGYSKCDFLYVETISLLLLYTKQTKISTVYEKFLGGNMNQDNNCCPQPYSDEYMIFDEMTGHYVLTEKAITERCAIDIRARFEEDRTVNVDAVIRKICRTVSDQIYNFIHDYTIYEQRQDWLIATNPYLRLQIQEAMEYQADYFMANGNLFLSTDNSQQGKEINQMSKDILLNSGICYSGV
jgi:hypothetical protein